MSAFGAFLLYAVTYVTIWGRPAVGHLATRYVGLFIGDADFYRWALAWTPWALTHGHNPLTTGVIYAPTGTTLTWTALTPAAAVAAWPLTAVFGSLVSFNVLMLLAPALAGWGVFLVCRRITAAFWPSMIGGALFASSAFITGHMVGHLDLVLVFPVPLAVYLVIRRLEGSISAIAFVAWSSAVLLMLFFISTEVFAMTALFVPIAFALAILAAGPYRRRILAAAGLTAAAFAIVGAIVLVPYVLPALHSAPPRTIRNPNRAAADLAGFIVPRKGMALGGARMSSYAGRFTANWWEDASYVGVGTVAMLACFAYTERRHRETWPLLAFVAIVFALSLGPVLHVGGTEYGHMPTAVLWRLPLIRNATPQRFGMFASLAIGVIASLWLSRRPRSLARWAVVAASLVLLLPSVPSPPWHPTDPIPAFFTSSEYRDVLRPGENVFVMPWHNGEEMLFQSAAGFSFRMPAGYIGWIPTQFHHERMFRGVFVEGINPLRPRPAELRAWLDAQSVTSVLVADAARPAFAALLTSAGLRPVFEGGGVSVWRTA